MAKIPLGVKILPKISIAWVGCTNVTDDRQTDRRQTDGPSMTYSEREREFTFAKNVAVVNALQLEAALATPVLSCLITTPCQVWSRWTYSLLYYTVFCCWYITLCWDIDFWFCDLDLWPWTFAQYRLWRDEILYQIWVQSSNPRRSYCDFNIWPNDPERRITCSACLWDIKEGRKGSDRSGDTLQGGDTQMEKIVAEFTKNSGQTRLDR